MKNIKFIALAVVALLVGLAAGYFIFGNNSEGKSANETHDHSADAGDKMNEGQVWSCSMHPQIRKDEPGDCPICGMDLIPAEGASSSDPLVLEMTEEAVKLAQIETTIIGSTGKSEKQFSLSGKIQADERLSSSLVAHIPGRIEQLFVTFTGERIREGQKLATIYSPELVSAQSELLEASKLQDVNPELVKAARKRLEYWKIPAEDIRAIEESGELLESFTVYAEASGVVSQRRVAVGDYLKQGEVLFDIIGLDRVWVIFDAYEDDLASIRVGNRIEFTTPALPDRSFSTRISFIDPVIDPSTRVASLRGEVSNASGLLKPEMFIRGTLNAGISKGEKLLVPKSAVLWTGKRSVVYVKLPDTNIPSYQFREIEIGARIGESYQVESGLEPGEEVVTYGSFAIDAAAQLNNKMSMMNRNVQLRDLDNTMKHPDFTGSTPQRFKQHLAVLTNSYLAIKDDLVNTDSSKAREGAEGFLENLSQVDMSLVKGDAHMYWMEQLGAMTAHSTSLSESVEVMEQRKQFNYLSQNLILTLKAFGVPSDTLYVQNCPMAFDNAGADWISDQAEIRNPYYGDSMLKCGSVVEIISKE